MEWGNFIIRGPYGLCLFTDVKMMYFRQVPSCIILTGGEITCITIGWSVSIADECRGTGNERGDFCLLGRNISLHINGATDLNTYSTFTFIGLVSTADW